jgi:hypothetical protein
MLRDKDLLGGGRVLSKDSALALTPVSAVHAVNIQWLTVGREFKECARFQ